MEEISKRINYLFNRYWDEDLPDQDQDDLEQYADNLVTEYNWNDIYKSAVDYLHNNCLSPESVINFACNYWNYGWYNYPIPDPHRFLAYFYYRINYETDRYDKIDILDSLATTILPKAGFSEADLVLNSQYMPENDPHIQEEVEHFRCLN